MIALRLVRAAAAVGSAILLVGCQPPDLPGAVPAQVAEQPASTPRRLALVIDASEPSILAQAVRMARRAVVEAAGPGDTILMVRVAETFVPTRDVAVATFPPLPPEALTTPSNANEFAAADAACGAAWEDCERQSASLLATLTAWSTLPQCHGTDLWSAVRYAADSLPKEAPLRLLVVASDLHHQVGRVHSQAPPADLLPLEGVAAKLLFVKDLATSRAKAAESWRGFLTSSGCAQVELSDWAHSLNQVLLPKSLAPRHPPLPW